MSDGSEPQDDPALQHLKELEEKVTKQKFFVEELETQKRKLLIAAQPESQWCSQAGCVMSRLISLAMDYNDGFVHHIISGRQIRDFLAIVNSVLKCFLQKYGQVLPNDESDEVSFLMALLEIVQKLTRTSTGRDFFANNKYGLALVKQFLVSMPGLPVPSGNALKRTLLLTVFNAFSRMGPTPTIGWRELLVAFEHSLRTDKDITFHMLYLSTIVNIVQRPPSPDFAAEFIKLVPSTCLEAATRSEAGGVAVMAAHVQKEVLCLLKQSRGRVQTESGPTLAPLVAVPCPGPCESTS